MSHHIAFLAILSFLLAQAHTTAAAYERIGPKDDMGMLLVETNSLRIAPRQTLATSNLFPSTVLATEVIPTSTALGILSTTPATSLTAMHLSSMSLTDVSPTTISSTINLPKVTTTMPQPTSTTSYSISIVSITPFGTPPTTTPSSGASSFKVGAVGVVVGLVMLLS